MSNLEVPYLEDNNRKGATRGEAIFGDKHARFVLTGTGVEQVTHTQEMQQKNEALANIGELATAAYNELAQRDDVDQDRLDAIAAHARK